MLHDEPFANFRDEVKSLRESYMARRMASNLYSPDGPGIFEVDVDHTGPVTIYEYWYEKDESGRQRYVRLHDIAKTLSGDILRLHRDLPATPYHIEIEGDIIRTVQNVPEMPEEIPPDDEDCSAGLQLLSVVAVDPTKHFTKKPKYNSEIYNHIKLRAGNETSSLSHVATLLGKSTQNELVFPKMQDALRTLASSKSYELAVYKHWILDLIDALQEIHCKGIIHKDLRLANLLFTQRSSEQDGKEEQVSDRDGTRYRLMLCDLESRWGNRTAPELDKTFESDAGWTEKSDIYDIAACIRCMIYANNPINNVIGAEWIVPQPLDKICEACTVSDPAKRPTLGELESLVKAIEVE